MRGNTPPGRPKWGTESAASRGSRKARRDEVFHGVERLEPLLFQRPEVDRHRQIEARQVLLANPPAPPQQVQEGQRREAGVLAARRPAQGAQRQDPPVQMNRVQNVAGFVPAGQSEDLVDGEVDGVEHETGPLVALGRHEPPGRVDETTRPWWPPRPCS